LEFLDSWKAAKVQLSKQSLLKRIRKGLLRSEESGGQYLARSDRFHIYTNSGVRILKKTVDITIKSALVFDANFGS